MGFKCGITGLPNVGKSTLFNALTQQHQLGCKLSIFTIEPNVGNVIVDDRLDKLAKVRIKKYNSYSNSVCRYCWFS